MVGIAIHVVRHPVHILRSLGVHNPHLKIMLITIKSWNSGTNEAFDHENPVDLGALGKLSSFVCMPICCLKNKSMRPK